MYIMHYMYMSVYKYIYIYKHFHILYNLAQGFEHIRRITLVEFTFKFVNENLKMNEGWVNVYCSFCFLLILLDLNIYIYINTTTPSSQPGK